MGDTLIGMVGNIDSFLAKQSNIILNTTVDQEACPNNLAPTTSTTAQLVMGDALAVCLMEMKGFKSEDFAKFHPGGMLGKKLYLRVSDLSASNEKPKVNPGQSLKEVIVEMTQKRLGVTAVVDEQNHLLGIITDGDLRRMLKNNVQIDSIRASDIMTVNPKTIGPDELAIEAPARKWGEGNREVAAGPRDKRARAGVRGKREPRALDADRDVADVPASRLVAEPGGDALGASRRQQAEVVARGKVGERDDTRAR